MAWQKFTNPRLSRRSTKLWLSVQKNGRIQLSKALVDELGSEHIALYFDPELRKIALEPVPKDDPDGVLIRKSTQQESWGVAAIGFMSRFEITVSRARQVAVHREGELWVADLGGVEEVSVGASG